ncbi:MAG: hypothetical protein J1F68_01055 [Clostridiales bacterium]|nr:hypothetical protein [Clostridiales bacterium]
MYQIIKKYCENNDKSNGLLLIDMPTGFGKTHSVLDYICDAVLSHKFDKKKVFFITTQKKNLPIDELKERFARRNEQVLFDEKFVFLDSNIDTVLTNWNAKLEKSMPSEITKTDEYRALKQDLLFIKRQKSDNTTKQLVETIEKNLREKTEPAFRGLIQAYLNKEFTSVKDKLYAIKTSERWQWLGRLYPAVFTQSKQIIFMSMDKFLSRNSTIVEPSYMFYNSDIIKDAVIFIDEFDATKATILNNIIENGLRDKIDYIELFREIYSGLQTTEFPSVLTTASRQRQASRFADQSLDGIIDDIRSKAEVLYKDFSLKFSHRTSVEAEDQNKNFLFQDHQFHSILNGNKSFIYTYSNEKLRLNEIKFADKKPQHDSQNIHVMLGKLRGFITYFQIGVSILAINYLETKRERHKTGEDDFSMESAIRSVLSEFRLSNDSIEYLTLQILSASPKRSTNIEGANYDLSFYERGFRYYAFENDTFHDMQSKIMMYSFQNTPEKILLKICERAKVIGISATATIPTNIGNYDMDYLQAKMKTAFCKVSQEDLKRLSDQYAIATKGYDNIDIDVSIIGENSEANYGLSAWQEVLKTERVYDVYENLEIMFSDDSNNYDKKRYCRVASAFKFFVQHDDIQSFLCVLTRHPRKNNAMLDIDFLLKIFKHIWEENKKEVFQEDTVIQLDGDEYDARKEHIISRLAKGERLFVISVYQTIGAGQNLQYPIPQGDRKRLIGVNDFDSRNEKDFDAIYLDKPTNLLVRLDEHLIEEDFAKYIFHVEFLQQNGQLSMTEAFSHIKKAFRCYMTGHARSEWVKNLYDLQDVKLLCTRTIIQAIGRICRTNQKKRKIYILADSRLHENIDKTIINSNLFNPEFLALMSKVQSTSCINNSNIAENTASLLSVRVNKFIQNILREDWTDDSMKDWKEMREMVLRNPTFSRNEIDMDKNFMINQLYVKLPQVQDRIFYQQESDFNNILVSFQQRSHFNYEVSAHDARLNVLMEIEGVKDQFNEKHYATTFKPGNFIVSPALYNNIYKGALGEFVGRYLLKRYFDIDLDEINDNDLFECFDFKVKDAPIYVDFKHWHESMTIDKEKMRSKIICKAKKCGCKCVLTINILTKEERPIVRSSGEVTIVDVPCLFFGYKKPQVSVKAFREIRSLIHEFSN